MNQPIIKQSYQLYQPRLQPRFVTRDQNAKNAKVKWEDAHTRFFVSSHALAEPRGRSNMSGNHMRNEQKPVAEGSKSGVISKMHHPVHQEF